jgi:glucose/arabinose dehydrogenase
VAPMHTSRSATLTCLSSILAGAALLAACGSDDPSGGGDPGGAVGASGAGASGNGGSGAQGGGSSSGASGPGGSGSGGFGGDAICPPEPTAGPPALKLTEVASGLERPVLAVGAGGDPSRLYVLQQTGQIRIIKDGALLPEPFLDIDPIVKNIGDQGDERGLLGMAFHPDYAQNGRFFVHYTDQEDDHGHVAEYRRSQDPDKADPAAVKMILQVTETQVGNHNGGMLAFGGDGLLYMGLGDGGGSGDPNDNGQNLDTKLGKILRIDPDTYPDGVAGNLPDANPHVWDYGLRNPWRFSFDRCTKDLYIGDVGQGNYEEVDVELAGQGHKNYGWNTTEGAHCFEPSSGCSMNGVTLPAVEYAQSDGGCTVIGGYVYRGSKMPNLVGTYFYGDYCSSKIWNIVWKDGALVSGPTEITDSIGSDAVQSISSFGEDAAGELYVVSLAGSIYRIDPQ